tara:strand:- start:1745 stop:2224 length:480 start_codon:yes stop_codon:yes gene_type:complete
MFLMKKFFIVCFFIISCDSHIQGVILDNHEYSELVNQIYEGYTKNNFDTFYKYLDTDVIAYYSSDTYHGLDEVLESWSYDHFYFSNIKTNTTKSNTIFLANGNYITMHTSDWSAIGKFSKQTFKSPSHFDFYWKNGKIIKIKAYFNNKIYTNENKLSNI